MFNAPEMSRTALVERSVGVASGAARRAFWSCLSMSLLQISGSGTRAHPPISGSVANESDEVLIGLVLVRGAHTVVEGGHVPFSKCRCANCLSLTPRAISV